MAFQEKLLGQSNPGNVATTIYTVPASTTAIIKTILICNTSSSTRSYRIFFNNSGATYNATNAIMYDIPILPNTTNSIEDFMPLNGSGASIGVSGSTTDVNFTVFGVEIS